MLTRKDCFSVAVFLDECETRLSIVAPDSRELSEVRRLRRIFDTLSGRGLDFTIDGARRPCQDPVTPTVET